MNAATTIDLSKLSLNELVELERQIASQIPKRRQAEIIDLRKEILANIAGAGFTVEEILGSAGGKLGALPKASAPKYRSNDGQTWTGRGRKPGWVIEHLAKGGKLTDLEI